MGGGSYASAEMQSMYSTTSADWTTLLKVIRKSEYLSHCFGLNSIENEKKPIMTWIFLGRKLVAND